jgi:energy-coupling factor transporter transmembrane protein EcfT
MRPPSEPSEPIGRARVRPARRDGAVPRPCCRQRGDAAVVLLCVAAIAMSATAPEPATSVILPALATVAVSAQLGTAARRRSLVRRWLAIAPLAGFTVAVRALVGSAEPSWLPAARMAVAAPWFGCLSTWLSALRLDAALRRLGAPAALLELLTQTRRFATQLTGTLREAWSAAALRGGQHDTAASLRSCGALAGVVLVRALDRAQAVADAAALRGAGLAASAPAMRGAR